MRYIEGSSRYQKILFPDVLDDYVAAENPVRVVDAFVDSLDLLGLGIKANSESGRPPYHPKDMLKLYIYGYFNRLRSSRRLETETTRNIELMWLMNKLSPDHKTIARFRRDNAKALKNVFRSFVKLCREMGLYGNELISIDGSKFEAVNSTDNNFNQKKLDERIRRIDEKLDRYLSELDDNDKNEKDAGKHTTEEITAMISELSARKQAYEGMKSQLDATGETQISTTDPDAKRMIQANGGSDISYNVQTAVDSKHKLIADYEVTNSCNDKNLLAKVAMSAKETLGMDEIAVVADKGYFVATDIAECVMNGITPHVSSEHDSITICIPATEEAAEANKPKGWNSQGKPVFIKERNIGLCPMGAILYPRSYSAGHGAAVYSNAKACRKCPQRSKCPSYYDRELKVKMPRSEFTKDCNDKDLFVKQVTITADKGILRRRKELSEHPFGTVKRAMDSRHCLMKGSDNVRGEFALTFLAYNMKRAINILGAERLLQVIRDHCLTSFSCSPVVAI
jgi:transposase